MCVCYLSLCVSRGMYYRYRSMPPAGSITLTFTQTEDSLSGRLCTCVWENGSSSTDSHTLSRVVCRSRPAY